MAAQVPPVQTWPAPQTLPQAPQFFESVWVLAQKALAPVPQVVKGLPQVTAQVPPVHTSPAGQALPQVPQFAESVWVFTHSEPHIVPLAPVQVAAHCPAEHTWPAAQTLPQAPQFAGSLWVSAQKALGPVPQVV